MDHAAGRVQRLRRITALGAAGSVVALVYLLGTPDRPHRGWMVVLALAVLAKDLASNRFARHLVASRHDSLLQVLNAITHIAVLGLLTFLDGGVASPLGPLVYSLLPFFASVYPWRIFVALAGAAVVDYWIVAVWGGTAPPGHALVYTLGFLAVGAMCAVHRSNMVDLHRRMARAAQLDALTGCLDRRAFDQRLEQELSRAARERSAVTLVRIDLDHFKAVNDAHGHQAGDVLLTWTGRTLQAAARADDVVGRLGGDEFAVILTGVGPGDAETAVTRLRDALEERTPASLGAASFPAEADTADALQELADQRSYLAKAGRGGRVAVDLPAFDDRAGTGADDGRPAATGRSDREVHGRRRSAISTGGLATSNYLIGTVFMLLTGRAEREPLLLAVMLGALASSLALLAGAGRLARLRSGYRVLAAAIAGLAGLGVVVMVLDGGFESPMVLGALLPLPLVALSAPWRALPQVLGGHLVLFLAIALVGSPSLWYVYVHVAGIVLISVMCAVESREADLQRRRLKALSDTDGLTGALNRRGFLRRFESEAAHAARHGGTLSVVLLDLDGFKAYNDTHGHPAGDELLWWVAATLTGMLRAHDVLGRLGGDEFVVLAPECGADDAAELANRLRDRVAARIGVSAGTATFAVDGCTFEDLYRVADRRLYAEKTGAAHHGP